MLLLLVVRSKNNPAYRQRLLERLGYFPKQIATKQISPKQGVSKSTFISRPIKQGGILVHAASVGEVIALKSFVEALLLAYPNTAITITTFTPTGSEQVKKLFADKVQHSYLPLDIFPLYTIIFTSLAAETCYFYGD